MHRTRLAPALAVGLVTAVIVVGACSTSRPGVGAQARARIASSPAPSLGSDSPLPIGGYPAQSQVVEVPVQPGVAKTQWRLPGRWSVTDYTDSLGLLRRELGRGYPDVDFWLLDLRTGRKSLVLRRLVNARRRYVALTARLSQHWIAWEEVAPVDDLKYPAEWSLYVARIDRDRAGVGTPLLVDHGSTRRRLRPLFALTGDTLCWLVNEGGKGAQCGTIWTCDLRRREPRALAVTAEAYHTLSLTGDEVLVTERVSRLSDRLQVMTYDLKGGERTSWIDLANEQPLVQYPSAGNGRLAWALFLDPENVSSSALYVRQPDGRIDLIDDRDAAHPVVVGDYLFYQSQGRYGEVDASSTVHVVDLRSLRDAILEECPYEQEGEWITPVVAAPAENTVVAYRQTYHTTRFADARTAIDVFSVTGD